MKSTPYELWAFYLPGASKETPEANAALHPGRKTVGGFVFTNGAMSLNLPELKVRRQVKYLEKFFGVKAERLQRVDVPTRARTFSPKSEAEGVLGLVGQNAPASQGQDANGGGNAGAEGAGQTVLPPKRGDHRERRTSRGSSVATKTAVDPATRQQLLGDGPKSEAVKAPETPPAAPAAPAAETSSSAPASDETAGLT